MLSNASRFPQIFNSTPCKKQALPSSTHGQDYGTDLTHSAACACHGEVVRLPWRVDYYVLSDEGIFPQAQNISISLALYIYFPQTQ